MKNPHSPFLTTKSLLAALACSIIALMAPLANAAPVVLSWSGNTSATWATGSNWIGGVAPTSDTISSIANFNLPTYGGNPVFAPNAGGNSTAGITIGNSNGAMTLAGNLTLGGGGITIASGAGQLTLSGGNNTLSTQTWVNNSSNALITTGAMSTGTATLSLAGAGGFTLNSVNDKTLTVLAGTGTTSIGTVNTSNSGVTCTNFSANQVTVGSGGITMGAQSTTFAGPGNWLVTGNITGTSTTNTFTKSGLGTFTMQGAASTVLDKLTISAGQFVISGSGALTGSSNATISVNSATLVLDNSSTVVANRISDNRTLDIGNLILKGQSGSSITETVGATNFGTTGTVQINNGSGSDVTTLALGNVTRSVGAAISFVGTNGTFGTGPKVTSSAAWAGVSNGILPWATVNGTNWAADNAGSIQAYGGSFVALASSIVSDNAQVSGNLSTGGATLASSLNVIANGAGQSLALGGNVTLGGAAGSAAAILKSGANAYTVSGSTINAGSGGAGTELITHVDGGDLTISSGLNASIVNIAKGGTGKLILSGTRASSFTTVGIDGTLEFQGASTTISGSITGLGGLVANLTTGQILTLSSTTPYVFSGGLTIQSGTVSFNGNGGSPGLTNSAITMNGGTLSLTNSGKTFKGLQGSAGSVTAGNNAVLTLNTDVGTSYDFSGLVGSGVGGIIKSGAGTQILSNTANTFNTGSVTIQDGVLEVKKLANFSSNSSIGAATSGAILIGNTNTTGTLRYTGTGDSSNRTIQIGVGTANGDFGGATIENNGTSGALVFTATNFNSALAGVTSINARTLTLSGSNAAANEIQGIIQDNGTGGNGTGAVSLAKAGNGTWAIRGVNTYSGTTTVSSGTLLIDGTNSGTGAVTVQSGGTLGGNGSTAGAVTIQSGGNLSPGNSPGLLTVANSVTIADGAKVTMEITGATVGTQYDRLTMTGSSSVFSLVGTNNLALSLSYTPADSALFFLVDNQGSSAISGIFEQLNGVTTDLSQGATFTVASQSFKISYVGDVAGNTFTGGNDLVVQAVPEPATWALLTFSLTTVVILRRRRNS
jgi:fibronectin-binding autotransporter adhesin